MVGVEGVNRNVQARPRRVIADGQVESLQLRKRLGPREIHVLAD